MLGEKDPLRCEVCGRKIIGTPYKAIIEGAKMLVCNKCVKLGSVSWESKSEPRMKKIVRRLPQQPTIAPRKQPPIVTEESTELIEDFGSRIRQAREKLGLTHEDLGKKINEKVSVLRKIESTSLTPNNLLVDKLQRALRIKLMVPVSEPKVPTKVLASLHPSAPTLGDIAQLKKEKEK